MKRDLKLALAMFLVILTLPLMMVKSSSNESIYLQDPIFGYINFMPDVMFESMYGGKYAPIKHPYLYLSSGKSVKCYEPTTGKLVHTIPYDSSKESPWEATDEGVTFLSSGNGNKYCRLARFNGSELVIPLDDKVYYVSWSSKPLLVYQGYDNVTRFYTFEAKDLDGQTVWKIEKITNYTRSSMHYFWVEISGKTSLIDMHTGELISSIPSPYGFLYSIGSVAIIVYPKFEKTTLFNVETDSIIYEGIDIKFVLGQEQILIYQPINERDRKNCFQFKKFSLDGKLIDQFYSNLPASFTEEVHHLSGFYNRLVTYVTVEGFKQKMIIFDTLNEKKVGEIESVSKSQIIDDKIFFIGDTHAGCFDLESMQTIWSIPIGNIFNHDFVYEKDFGNIKIYGREVVSRFNKNTLSLQVKIIDKADGFVEPFEFEFEYGGVRNCYETDYGFININDLSRFSIYTPQISFYRKGTIKAVGTIDYIGEFVEDTISIEDGRYLVAKLKDGRTVEIDCRTTTYRTK